MSNHANIPPYLAEASGSAANKASLLGNAGIIYGWLSSTEGALLTGVIVTLLGGLWSFAAMIQKRREHRLRISILEEELAAVRTRRNVVFERGSSLERVAEQMGMLDD